MPRPVPLDGEARVAALDGLRGAAWVEVQTRDAIAKEFRFADFAEAFAFMTRVALLAERMDHHPRWSNSYRVVEIELTSHDAGGVTERDIAMARSIDAMVPPAGGR